MKSSIVKVGITSIFLCLFAFSTVAQMSKIKDFNALSVEFLTRTKNKQDTQAIRDQFANTTLKELEEGLTTDDQKFAFWIDFYNAYIQTILSENPELYKDRQAFFSAEQIPIAGELVSFAKIEHGIIRKSQWPLGLGRIRKWFPNKFERKLRVDKRRYHVHFALNCGAKDCPPVAVYTEKSIKEQFAKGTERYLSRTSSYDEDKKEVAVTSLFSWFRGDFGGKSGTKKILKEHGIIPTTKDIDIIFKNYDWTLDLDNWTDL